MIARGIILTVSVVSCISRIIRKHGPFVYTLRRTFPRWLRSLAIKTEGIYIGLLCVSPTLYVSFSLSLYSSQNLFLSFLFSFCFLSNSSRALDRDSWQRNFLSPFETFSHSSRWNGREDRCVRLTFETRRRYRKNITILLYVRAQSSFSCFRLPFTPPFLFLCLFPCNPRAENRATVFLPLLRITFERTSIRRSSMLEAFFHIISATNEQTCELFDFEVNFYRKNLWEELIQAVPGCLLLLKGKKKKKHKNRSWNREQKGSPLDWSVKEPLGKTPWFSPPFIVCQAIVC